MVLIATDNRVRVVEGLGDDEFRLVLHGEEGPVQIPDLPSKNRAHTSYPQLGAPTR